jgi:hypothetical protein
MAQVLDREWETYEQQRAGLLEAHKGKFVLIHDDKLLGIFNSRAAAREEGYRQLGRVPFLIQEIAAEERPRRVISHTFRG